MPTYEYACRTCGHRFEVVQSMRDDALTECPECGGELRKVFAPPAIAFKGSGFYATDHAKKAPSSSESKPERKGEGKGEGTSGGGKSDKPETDKGGGDQGAPPAPSPSSRPSGEAGSSGTAGTKETTPS